MELVYEAPLLMFIETFEGAVVSDVEGVGAGVAVAVVVVNDDSPPYDVPALLLAAIL